MQVKTDARSTLIGWRINMFFELDILDASAHFPRMSTKKTHIANKAKSDEKQARLAEALRANLRRRKVQAKEQASASRGDGNDS